MVLLFFVSLLRIHNLVYDPDLSSKQVDFKALRFQLRKCCEAVLAHTLRLVG